MLSYKSRLHKNRDKNSCVFALFFFFLKLTTSAYSWPVSLFLWWSYSACMEYLSAHRSTSLTAEISASILAHPLSIVHYWCQSAICLALFLWTVCLSLIRGCTSLPICTINLIVSEYILIALHNTCPCPFFLSHPFLYSVPRPVFFQDLIIWNSLSFFFFLFLGWFSHNNKTYRERSKSCWKIWSKAHYHGHYFFDNPPTLLPCFCRFWLIQEHLRREMLSSKSHI